MTCISKALCSTNYASKNRYANFPDGQLDENDKKQQGKENGPTPIIA